MKVTYEPGALVIKVPTKDPPAMHRELMKGLNSSMRNCLLIHEEPEAQLSLVTLLDTLLPQGESM